MTDYEKNLKQYEYDKGNDKDGLPRTYSMMEHEEYIKSRYGSYDEWFNQYCEALAKEFYRAITNRYSHGITENTPVYVFESLDGYYAINNGFRGERMPKPSFLLDDGFLLGALDGHHEKVNTVSGWCPIGYEPSPVILVYDDCHSDRVERFTQILKKANITFYLQDVDDVQGLIYKTNSLDVAAEIQKQASNDYEPSLTEERTLALWTI